MYSADSKITYESVKTWKRDIERVNPNIPIYILCNKMDVKELKKVGDIQLSCKNDVYHDEVFNMLANDVHGPLSSNVKTVSSSNVTFVDSNDIKNIITKYGKMIYGCNNSFLQLLEQINNENNIIFNMINITLFFKNNTEIHDNDEILNHFNDNYMIMHNGTYINATLKLWLVFIKNNTYDICDDVYRTIKHEFPEIEYLVQKR